MPLAHVNRRKRLFGTWKKSERCIGASNRSMRGRGIGMVVAGTCFGSGPELGFKPTQKTIGLMADAPKLVPPNANAEDSAIKGSEDEDSMERAYMVNAPEGKDKELNRWAIIQRKKRANKRSHLKPSSRKTLTILGTMNVPLPYENRAF
jgi:hypothetical protein